MPQNEESPSWHPEVIKADVDRTLQDLNQRSLLDDFYLAGGTGLALQLGHRRSVDLGFFSGQMYTSLTRG